MDGIYNCRRAYRGRGNKDKSSTDKRRTSQQSLFLAKRWRNIFIHLALKQEDSSDRCKRATLETRAIRIMIVAQHDAETYLSSENPRGVVVLTVKNMIPIFTAIS